MSKTGYIYKIWSKADSNLAYYGSTSQPRVCTRINNHRCSFKGWKSGTHRFVTSFLVMDAGDWDYMTCEKIMYDDKFELHNRERWYIENNECVNKVIPNRKVCQKEYSKEYSKEYRDTHKEEKKKINKEYKKLFAEELNGKQREKVKCECGCLVNRSGLSNHKKSKKHIRLLELNNNC